MDFHAHLNMNEVIGLLAGECHEDRRLIRSAPLSAVAWSQDGHMLGCMFSGSTVGF